MAWWADGHWQGKISHWEKFVIERGRKEQGKARKKAVFAAIDRGHDRRGSSVVQGGLPSLGKRRP